MKSVLLSLKPEWWEKIRSHEKTLEIRKSRPMDVELPVRVIVYATKPVGKIVGEFLSGHFLRRNNVGGLAARSMVPLQELIAYADGMCRNCECCAENDFKFWVKKPQDCDMWEDAE